MKSAYRDRRGSPGTLTRTYDLAGNGAFRDPDTKNTGVTTRFFGNFAGAQPSPSPTMPPTGSKTNSFSGSNSVARSYTYDLDSDRTGVTEAGTTFYYAYDATDELEWKGPNQNGSGSSAFTYDSLGQLTASQPTLPGLGSLHPTTYAYDPAGHLAGITADGVTTSFPIDALGRHGCRHSARVPLPPTPTWAPPTR